MRASIMKTIAGSAAITTTVLMSQANAAPVTCMVADPTGTPVNMRIQPNGSILATVRQGERVQVFLEKTITDNRGQVWRSVARGTSSAPDGYILARQLRCP